MKKIFMTGLLLGAIVLTAMNGKDTVEVQAKTTQESSYNKTVKSLYKKKISQLKKEYGTPDRRPFTTCYGNDLMEGDPNAFGYITSRIRDMDQDGKYDLLVARSDYNANSIIVEFYEEQDGEVNKVYENTLCQVAYSMQTEIQFYKDSSTGRYYFFVDQESTGAYTENHSKEAYLYEIDGLAINEVYHWEWDELINSDSSEAELIYNLKAHGVKSAHNCTEFGSANNKRTLVMIAHTVLRESEDEFVYRNLHFLQIVPDKDQVTRIFWNTDTPEEEDLTSKEHGNGINQVWTITKHNTGMYEEYKEITYTKEWEDGTIHVVAPEFEVGSGETYGIMDYKVNMKKHTIDVTLDYPEGDSCFQKLVIDLYKDTYYGADYMVCN